MWPLHNTTKYLNTVVLTCADGRCNCRMVLNNWIPYMSSEHCGALYSSTIAHTRNLSLSSISINITSYFFSSPPIPCSCFAKCNCKPSLHFFQYLLHACLMGFSSARRVFEQQLMNMSRTLHSGQCLVMLSFWFYVLRKASHHPGKMKWVGTFPFELPYSNPELIKDDAGNTRCFTDFETFIDCVKITSFCISPLLPVFLYWTEQPLPTSFINSPFLRHSTSPRHLIPYNDLPLFNTSSFNRCTSSILLCLYVFVSYYSDFMG